jgi:hypothetical protein
MSYLNKLIFFDILIKSLFFMKMTENLKICPI